MAREVKRRRKTNLDFVKRLMVINGEDYEDWLDDQHLNYIDENQDVIMLALETQAESMSNNKN